MWDAGPHGLGSIMLVDRPFPPHRAVNRVRLTILSNPVPQSARI